MRTDRIVEGLLTDGLFGKSSAYDQVKAILLVLDKAYTNLGNLEHDHSASPNTQRYTHEARQHIQRAMQSLTRVE